MSMANIPYVETSKVEACLQDFRNRFNAHQRVKKLINNWNRFLRVEATDSGSVFTLPISELLIQEVQPGTLGIDDDNEDLIHVQANEETLIRIFSGKYNPATAVIDGAMAVYSSERDKVKLEAIAMVIWGI